MTYPRGPQETGGMFFAKGRLGVAAWCCFIWAGNGCAGKNGTYITVMTRVLEKPAVLTDIIFFII